MTLLRVLGLSAAACLVVLGAVACGGTSNVPTSTPNVRPISNAGFNSRLGPLTANVSQIAFDPVTHRLSFAFTDAGLFKSSDAGATWNLVTTASPLTPNPSQPNVVYDERNNGMFRSNDGGVTWAKDKSGLSRLGNIYPIPGTVGGVFATTSNGLLKSLDDGTSWTPSNTGLHSPYVSLTTDPKNPSHWFATEYGGKNLYQSQDGGLTWSLVRTFDEYMFGITAVAIDPSNSSNVYVGGEAGAGFFTQLFRSTDGGTTWISVNRGAVGPWAIDYILINPRNPNILYIGSKGRLFRSSDGGSNFEYVKSSGTGELNFALLDPADPSILLAGTKGGVYESLDGGMTWRNKSVGFIHTPYEKTYFVLSDESGRLFAGTEDGLFVSTDTNHQRWTSIYDGGAVYVLLLPTTSAPSFYAGTSRGLLASSDDGKTWKTMATGLSSDVPIVALARDPFDLNQLLMGTRGLFASTDGGTTWHPRGGSFAIFISSLVPGTMQGQYYALADDNLYLTADSGTTWQKVTPSSAKVDSIGIDAASRTVYVGSNIGVFARQQTEAAWIQLADFRRILVASGQSPSVVYALTSEGLFRANGRGGFQLERPFHVVGGVTGNAFCLEQKTGDLIAVDNQGAVVVFR